MPFPNVVCFTRRWWPCCRSRRLRGKCKCKLVAAMENRLVARTKTFEVVKLLVFFGDLANFIGGAGCDARAGATLHDGMVYQRRKVQVLVVGTDLVRSIVLCSDFFPCLDHKWGWDCWCGHYHNITNCSFNKSSSSTFTSTYCVHRVPLWCSSTYPFSFTFAISNITSLFQRQCSTSKRSNFTYPSFKLTST